LRLFKTSEEAANVTRTGLERLIELQLRYELAWLQKDLKVLRDLGTLTATLAPMEALQEHAFQSIRKWICARSVAPLTAAAFASALEKAKLDLRGIAPRLADLLREILTLRLALLVHPHPYGGQGPDLAALISPEFLQTTPYEQLAQFPRYLKAMRLRADRRRQNPIKDSERMKQLAPYAKAALELRARAGGEAFRWLVEEYRVSLFAQELGTAEPVSEVKLERVLADLKAGTPSSQAISPQSGVGAAQKSPSTTPILAAKAGTKKTAPLKNLSSLDALFPRG